VDINEQDRDLEQTFAEMRQQPGMEGIDFGYGDKDKDEDKKKKEWNDDFSKKPSAVSERGIVDSITDGEFSCDQKERYMHTCLDYITCTRTDVNRNSFLGVTDFVHTAGDALKSGWSKLFGSSDAEL